MSGEAADIYQSVLDNVSRALMASDFEGIMRHTKMPHVRRTLSDYTIIECEEDMRIGMTNLHRWLKDQGVDSYIRLVSTAEFLSPRYIEGWHVTHILKGALRVVPSYAARCVLVEDQGVWKTTEIDVQSHSRSHSFVHAIPVREGLDVPLRAPVAGADARREAAEPIAIYQDVLNALTDAGARGDFDTFFAGFDTPHTYHSRTHDVHIATRADSRQFFDLLGERLVAHGATGRRRQATLAEFVSSDLICGYHESYLTKGEEICFGPILSRLILRRRGARWLIQSVTNNVDETDTTLLTDQPEEALVSMREIQERTKKWQTSR